LLCEEHGNDPDHTVSRYILEQTPLQLIVYDPRTNRLETVTELSILNRIKVSSTSVITCSAPRASSGKTGSTP